MKPIALKCLMVFLPLMLQKPSKSSKAKDHCKYLQKVLLPWEKGNLRALLSECLKIQKRLAISKQKSMINLTKSFTNLMLSGKFTQASKLIKRTNSGLLQMDDEVKVLLLNKHPRASSADYNCLLSGPEEKVEEVIFESIDSDLVYKTAKMINGSGGPTLIDSECWKHLLCSNNFKVQQKNLCDAIAKLAQQICVTQINPAHFKELFASRLIPLYKCPGVRPIGIEVLRRIIGKCVMKTLKVDVEESVGNIQTCGGQQAGIEAAIHAMQEIYNKNESEALLLVDATNAFNSFNRQVALKNVKILCPNIAQYTENTYKQPSPLYIAGGNGEFISSEEGTTQGDNCDGILCHQYSTHRKTSA